MVRQLKLKDQTSYVKTITVLGKYFDFDPVNGLTLPDGEYWDKIVDALLSVPGVELVSGDKPASIPQPKEEAKPEPSQPEGKSLGANTAQKPSPGIQPAKVSVEEPKEEAQPKEENKEEQVETKPEDKGEN